MLRTLGTMILPIASIMSGYLLSKVDPVEGAFAPYLTTQWQLPVLLSLGLLLSVLVPYSILQNNKYKNHKEEQRALFKAALLIIGARTRITLDLINEFEAVFNENKYFIKPSQENTLCALITDLGDVRIDDEELKGSGLSPKERKFTVTHRRKLLDRIEKASSPIDKYIRKLT